LKGPDQMTRRIWTISLIVALAGAFAGCTPQGTATTTNPAGVVSPTPTTALQSTVPGSAADIQSVTESVYAAVNPSVVNIEVILPSSPTNPGGGASGSGFVWDTNGDIVTNNHVVDGATSISVTFFDGTIVDAALVGHDADSDLAVIKVDPAAGQLKPVVLADSTQLKVGQLAIAIGNPFGLQGTMTVGFVSALGRLLPADRTGTGPNYSISDVIQTDASINPGNSGGVLLDDSGKVIGVTNSIDTTTGTSSGVGFAIPSATVQRVVPALIKSGHYDHPYLGISVGSVTPDLAKAMNLPTTQRGALVGSVTAGGPADKAGLKGGQTSVTINGQQVSVGGDVIIAFNGQAVKSSDDLVTLLERSGIVGQAATLRVLRGGAQIDVQVTLGARPGA
jgi:S1-C subfamily serine protease